MVALTAASLVEMMDLMAVKKAVLMAGLMAALMAASKVEMMAGLRAEKMAA